MADQPEPQKLPQASVVKRKRMRISIVWIIPLLAAVVAIGIAVQRALSQGPLITITFKSADGVEAGKTFIKYKDVRIGQVTAVELSPDYSKVVVKARIAKHAAGLMVEDAKFWVVEPRITLSGVSGLNTLLSGNYIGFEAGKTLDEQRSFVGLDDPPVITGQRGRTFVLQAATLGSLDIGSPVYFRRINVGQVAGFSLADDGKSVHVTVFVRAPYDKYVTTESRFWNASGFDVSIGADGVDVRTESLAALIAGGIAFTTPPFAAQATRAPDDATFTLFANRATALRQPDPIERRFVLYFDESVRGLSVGAPVTIYGLRVGEVADVGLSMDRRKGTFRPRVLITFFPERVVSMLTEKQQAVGGPMTGASREERLQMMKKVIEEQGLRAQLKTGSLITGELYVDFAYYPQAPKVKLDVGRDPIELPVVPGGLANIEAKLTSILAKVDALPLDAIASDVRSTLGALTQTLKDASVLVNRVETQWVPEGTKTLEDLRKAIGTADRALNSVDKTVNNADSALFGKDSPAPQDLRDTLQEVTRAARSVRVLLDYLERHPEILIRGKPEPK